jgi:hypothetical protein
MYKFKYKLWWQIGTRTVMVIGHKYLPEQDKMALFLPDGGIQEVARWSKHVVTLGPDWVAFTKKNMEQQAGMSIPLNVGS